MEPVKGLKKFAAGENVTDHLSGALQRTNIK
jgi:hypothetical protein